MSTPIEGQLNAVERQMLRTAVVEEPRKPKVVVEVGTWLGGGSTIHLLKALEENGEGHLWGIEANRSIYEQMLANISQAAPEAKHRFTPLFGFSDDVLPQWIREQPKPLHVDLAFLDGGNNPGEQITEFRLLDPLIPVGGQLMAHDALVRKGKWLIPYVGLLDNWECSVRDVSETGLFYARKIAERPSAKSLQDARRKLLKMRLQPIEIAAAILPSWFCGFVLRLLPPGFSRRLSDGAR